MQTKSFTRHTVDSIRKMKVGYSIDIWASSGIVAPIVQMFRYATDKQFSTRADGKKTVVKRAK